MSQSGWRLRFSFLREEKELREPSVSSFSHSLTRLLSSRLVCFLSFVILCGAVGARAQISPGPLSKAHSSLNGATQCTACHSLAVGSAQLKCLDCHTEMRQRLAERRGLHATFLEKGAVGKDCVRCHSEHNGENFPLLWSEASLKEFDHRRTGYPLEGRHAGLTCNQCHSAQHVAGAERKTIKMTDLNRTYLGLSRDCLNCHLDEHHGQLKSNCASCHNFAGWKPVPGFDHAKTKFALTGGHEKVACLKCHAMVDGPKPYIKYVGIKFHTCTDCHADPHRGAFPDTCQTCHTTISWKQVHMEGKFDHSQTRFPLLGKHEAVGCENCHRRAAFKSPVPHQKCADCHTPDPHRGQFKHRAGGGECTDCHDEKGFKPALFTVARHAIAGYPLEGKHADVSCAKCHIPKGADTSFKMKSTLCIACHADIHKGQFTASPHKNLCENCHTVGGFQPSNFSVARHNHTQFPLTGGHIAVACVECHKAVDGGYPTGFVKYRFEDRSCTVCHADPHKAQFDRRMNVRRADGSPLGCEACHTTDSWPELTGFDHSTTSFPLVGAHRGVSCEKCHHPANLGEDLRSVDFHAAPKLCSGCHEDIHGGQFSVRKEPPDCAKCHTSFRWKPSLFDHEKDTTFSLKGAHQEVQCADCHTTVRIVEGKKVLFYKETPRDCAACHDSASEFSPTVLSRFFRQSTGASPRRAPGA